MTHVDPVEVTYRNLPTPDLLEAMAKTTADRLVTHRVEFSQPFFRPHADALLTRLLRNGRGMYAPKDTDLFRLANAAYEDVFHHPALRSDIRDFARGALTALSGTEVTSHLKLRTYERFFEAMNRRLETFLYAPVGEWHR